jgi:small subunit ribosomal protein S13
MVYLLNTNIEGKKKLYIALQNIYGLGKCQCLLICDSLGISREKCVKQLSNLEFERLTQFISQNYEIGPDIKKYKVQNVQRLVKIGCYRGFRHTEGLPVRGQRTHGNSRTIRKLKLPLN